MISLKFKSTKKSQKNYLMIWKEKVQSKKNPFSFFLRPHSPIPSGQKLWYGNKCVGIVINMSLLLTMISWSHW